MQSENLEKLTINYLTELEYLEAKAKGLLNDDELYMTPDSTGVGGLDIYSTNEVKTNKIWDDGRPVYRKLVKFGVINSGVMYEIDYDFSNVLELTKIYGTFVSEEGYVSPIDFTLSADTTYAVSVQAWTSRNKLRVWPSSKIKIMNAWILLEYTKKEDEENDGALSSGDFTGGKIYSLNEVKTGNYWLDGKPLYRKTFEITITGTFHQINMSEYNIDKIFFDFGHSIMTYGTNFQPLDRFWNSTNYNLCSYSEGNINLDFGSVYNFSKKVFLTIEYTKTTD